MNIDQIITLSVSIVLPIIGGIVSYFASIGKSKKDLAQLREQNKFEIERLMKQHALDLEAVEQNHQMEIEKMKLEQQNKIELMEKETENKFKESLSDTLGKEMISQFVKSPEFRNQINKSALQGFSRKKH